MIAEERFNKRGAKQVEVEYHTSRSSLQRDSDEPISLYLKRPDTGALLRIFMSRAEARSLSVQLGLHARGDEPE